MKFISIQKHYKYLVAICLLGILLLFSLRFITEHSILKRIKYKLIDNHGVFVETDDHLDIKYVSIKWISDKGEKFIFRNGKRVNRLGYDGGENAFQVYYKDSLIKGFGHVINIWNNTNDYYFNIYHTDNIHATFKVVGPDSISPLYWDEVFHPSTLDSIAIRKRQLLIPSEKDTSFRYIIDLTVQPKDYERIVNNDHSKFSLKNAKISINNTALDIKKLKLAGGTSLKYRRKSLKVSLKENYDMDNQGSYLSIDNFRLVSLSMDPYYFNMFISYSLMKKVGLFDLFFSYVELIINNETQGIYLLIEEPDHYALKRNSSNFILRKDYRHSSFTQAIFTELEYESDHKSDSLSDFDYLQSFQSIYTNLNIYNGKELFDSLNIHLNIDLYMKWMAINYLLCNGDYTDELYLYSNNNLKTVNFNIIPWDYDDILRNSPHEGWDHRHINIGNKLIYSIEDSLDLKIANDNYLYSRYLKNLSEVLKLLDEQTIKEVFNDVNSALTPYIKNHEIRSMSRYDKTYINNYNEFIDHLNASCLFLMERRNIINNRLDHSKTVELSIR